METKILTQQETDIEQAAQIIKEGGLVVFPTETVYGLGANALDSTAAAKIYTAKGRPSDNPLICHIADPKDAEKYCVTNALYYRLAQRFMPGPLTVILQKRYTSDGVPVIGDKVTGGLDSAALRVPSNETARILIRKSGVPIAAPSANLSGSPSPTTLRHVIEDMAGRVDAILDGGQCEIGLESTVVTVKGSDGLVLLRPGAVTLEMLRDICPDTVVDPSVFEKFDGKPLSPGMKYRHYAPKAKVILLEGTDEKVYSFLSDKTGCGILCYDEDTALLQLPYVQSIGGKADPAQQAHRLFACLRDFHDVDTIYARMPRHDGIGLAVFNRLIKAAGYEIMKL